MFKMKSDWVQNLCRWIKQLSGRQNLNFSLIRWRFSRNTTMNCSFVELFWGCALSLQHVLCAPQTHLILFCCTIFDSCVLTPLMLITSAIPQKILPAPPPSSLKQSFKLCGDSSFFFSHEKRGAYNQRAVHVHEGRTWKGRTRNFAIFLSPSHPLNTSQQTHFICRH